MPTEFQRLDDLHSIRRYVNETLCRQDQLETNHFPLSERILVRGGAPCGVFFCLHGPRSLCLTAIWETDGKVSKFIHISRDITQHRKEEEEITRRLEW